MNNPGKTSEDAFPRTVAIVGLGLLGGSLGLALKRLPAPPRVLAWARRADSVRDALALGMIDAGSTAAADILPQADLTILCLPVARCSEFAAAHAALFRHGGVVTDVGSTKCELVEALTPLLAAHGVAFVGSHPMAGSEKSGLAHAQASLYRDATVFITPATAADTAAVSMIHEFWSRFGARTHELSPARHDALTARTSHALHIAAAAAVRAVLKDPDAVLGTAGGFRDFTRIASSSTEMWTEICQANRGEIIRALDEFTAEIATARQALAANDAEAITDFLRSGCALRNQWLADWRRRRGDSGEESL